MMPIEEPPAKVNWEEYTRTHYMTEKEFLDLVAKAYESRWGRSVGEADEPGHPTDRASEFVAFAEAFAATLDSYMYFVASKVRNPK